MEMTVIRPTWISVDDLPEPLIWSGRTDQLPEQHVLAYTTLYCPGCGAMLHAMNNENMQVWVEVPQLDGASDWLCLQCFASLVHMNGDVLDD